MLRGSSASPYRSALADILNCLDDSERFVYEVKKLLEGIKDLKSGRGETQNQRNRPSSL